MHSNTSFFARELHPRVPANWGLPRCRCCGAQFRPQHNAHTHCRRCAPKAAA